MFKKSMIALSVATLAGVGAADVLPQAHAKSPGANSLIQLAACSPCAAKSASNPCNPCAAKKKVLLKKGNPCNPCAAKNPCNPCAAKKK